LPLVDVNSLRKAEGFPHIRRPSRNNCGQDVRAPHQILMMMFFRYSSHMKKSQSKINEIANASEALLGGSQDA
jgi:hypothetical protein